MLKKLSVALIALSGVVSAAAHADESPAAAPVAAAAASPFTGSFTVVSDYRVRGLSQTRNHPALQGEFDYAFKNGAYVGTFLSSVGDAAYNYGYLEDDLYGGYRGTFGKVAYDAGFVHYTYPNARYMGTTQKYNFNETYLGLTLGDFSAKVNVSVGDFLGITPTSYPALSTKGSSGSTYLDLSYNRELVKDLALNLHAGHQTVRNYSPLSYSDYKIGATYAGPASMTYSLAWMKTNADKTLYAWYPTNNVNNTKFAGKSGLVASVSKSF